MATLTTVICVSMDNEGSTNDRVLAAKGDMFILVLEMGTTILRGCDIS